MANPAGVTAGVIFTTAHASAAFASMSIVCGVSEIPRYRSSTPVLHPRHLVFSTPPFLRPCPLLLLWCCTPEAEFAKLLLDMLNTRNAVWQARERYDAGACQGVQML